MSTTSDRNPYQPPKADVTPPAEDFDAGELVAEGQSVPAGNAMTWIGDGFKLFGRSPGIWIVNTIIVMLMSFVLAFIPIVGGLASTLLMPVIIGGIMLGCRSLDSGDTLRVEHLFSAFSGKAGQLVLVGLFMLVGYIILIIGMVVIAVAVLGAGVLQNIGDQQALTTWFLEKGIVTLLLLVLVAVALCIPLAMAYWFAPALVVFHNMEAFAAMKSSFQGCLRNFVPFLLYGIVLFVLMIIAAIPILLGFLVIIPVLYASIYASYKDIYLKR